MTRPTHTSPSNQTPLEAAVRKQLDSLARSQGELSALSFDISARLQILYEERFPKVCGTCGAVYASREQWEEGTEELPGSSSHYEDQTSVVHDYRNCPCGSTLLIVVDDRRDASTFGTARRKLFDECVERILRFTGAPRQAAVRRVRAIFQATTRGARSSSARTMGAAILCLGLTAAAGPVGAAGPPKLPPLPGQGIAVPAPEPPPADVPAPAPVAPAPAPPAPVAPAPVAPAPAPPAPVAPAPPATGKDAPAHPPASQPPVSQPRRAPASSSLDAPATRTFHSVPATR